MCVHIILSQLFREGRVSILNIVSVILMGNVVLKLREFLTYGLTVGIYVLQHTWSIYAIVVATHITILAIAATLFNKLIGFVRINEIHATSPIKFREVLKLFTKVWIIYTITYYTLITLSELDLLTVSSSFLRNIGLPPTMTILLASYTVSPIATWHLIDDLWVEKSITLSELITVFILGKWSHFMFNVLRSGLPILSLLYGFRNGVKIVLLNITLISITYFTTFSLLCNSCVIKCLKQVMQ